MKLAEYAYFSITSHSLSADQIADRVGIAPDVVRPAAGRESWQIGKIEAGTSSAESTLTAQIDGLIERLKGCQGAIGALCRAPGNRCMLHIVRGYEPSDTEARMGITFSREAVAVLGAMGAAIDIDEYDYSASLSQQE